ncbi:hypothetical protein TTRE_0000015901 [Trichuris trichiura]|uniref:Uncharacterized protein n=1 Tax=Trichuris trichiura TaxID=36087 RepID=A0A077YZU5_TRITR|nr:hypothetical protein TTRE_0000015901 [Trichuris trichiura]
MEDISDSPCGRCEVLPVSHREQRRIAELAVLASWVLLFAHWFTVQLVSSVNRKAEVDKKGTGERKTNLMIWQRVLWETAGAAFQQGICFEKLWLL